MGSKADEICMEPNKTQDTANCLAECDLVTDCEFLVGPEEVVIKGHKRLFSAASDVFNAMFFGDLKETKPVHVVDLEPDQFEAMKTFIYTGQTDFKSVFEALSIFIAARKYLVEKLKQKCVGYIKKSLKPSQVLEFLDCCRMNFISEFDDLCVHFIMWRTEKVTRSDYFTETSIETIELILESNILTLEREIQVFSLFERWVLAEVHRRKIPANDIATSFGSLKKHIRFLTISESQFRHLIRPSPLLTEEEKLVILMNITLHWGLTSENISMLEQNRIFMSTSHLPSRIFTSEERCKIFNDAMSYGGR